MPSRRLQTVRRFIAVLPRAGSRHPVNTAYKGGMMPREGENVGLMVHAGLGMDRDWLVLVSVVQRMADRIGLW